MNNNTINRHIQHRTRRTRSLPSPFASINILSSTLITSTKKNEKNNKKVNNITSSNINSSSSIEIITKEFLMNEKDDKGHTALLWLLMNKYDNELLYYDNKTTINLKSIIMIISKLIDIGGKEYLLMSRDKVLGRTVLYWAFESTYIISSSSHKYNNIDMMDMIIKLINVGGKDLICALDKKKNTVLTSIQPSWVQSQRTKTTTNKKNSLNNNNNNNNNNEDDKEKEDKIQKIFSQMINIGGKDFLISQNQKGCTLLHHLNFSNIPMILSQILNVGGKDLVMIKNLHGVTALHYACYFMKPFDVVEAMIKVGGKDLVMAMDDAEVSTLQLACEHSAPTEVTSLLIDVGGCDLVRKRGCYECTALHNACENGATIAVITKLIDVGGIEVLQSQDYDGWTAFLSPYFSSRCYEKSFGITFQFMFQKYIQAEIGGEFGIGGLFNCSNQMNQEKIYSRWDEMFPFIVKPLLEVQFQPKILHAAIHSNAPPKIIMNICTEFDYCILTKDSKGRYPIVLAAERGLRWDEGMSILVEKMAQVQNSSVLYVAAKYGLKWNDGMKAVAESSTNEVETGYDRTTGLRAFMLAAADEWSDLSSIYSLIRMFPNHVQPSNEL